MKVLLNKKVVAIQFLVILGALALAISTVSILQAQAATGFRAYDFFNRPDQQGWGTAPDGGGKWGGDANVAKAFTVTNSKGQISGGSGSYNALLGASFKNGWVQVRGMLNDYGGTICDSTFSGKRCNFGAILRWKDRDNWYKAYVNGTELVIEKKLNGKYVRLGATNALIPSLILHEIDFQALDNKLTAHLYSYKQDRLSLITSITVWDSSLTAGVAGLRVDLASGSVARFDKVSLAAPSSWNP